MPRADVDAVIAGAGALLAAMGAGPSRERPARQLSEALQTAHRYLAAAQSPGMDVAGLVSADVVRSVAHAVRSLSSAVLSGAGPRPAEAVVERLVTALKSWAEDGTGASGLQDPEPDELLALWAAADPSGAPDDDSWSQMRR